MAFIMPFFMLVFMTLRLLVMVAFQTIRVMLMLVMAASGKRAPRFGPSLRTGRIF